MGSRCVPVPSHPDGPPNAVVVSLQRNALRLNGTGYEDTLPTTTATRPTTTSTSNSTGTSENDATRVVKLGGAAVAPILALAIAFL